MKVMKSKITKYPIYPILFSMYPVLHTYLINTQYITKNSLWRPLTISVLIFSVVYLLLSRLYKSTAKGALATTVTIFLFYTYGRLLYTSPDYNIFGFIIQSYVMLYYIYFGFFVTFLMFLKVKPSISPNIAKFLNLLSIFLLIITFVTNSTYGQNVLGTSTKRSQQISKEFKTQTVTYNPKLEVGAAPDIYYIILDGHTRSDNLTKVFDLDNSEFTDGLRDLGFLVTELSYTNYMQTQLSLASSLNMEYLDKLPPLVGERSNDRTTLNQLRIDSVVVNKLVDSGYQKVYVNGAWNYHFNELSTLEEAGFTLTSEDQLPDYLNQLEKVLIGTSILTDPTTSVYDQYRKMLLNSYTLSKTVARIDEPTITYMHVLSPHPPFVWDEFGNPFDPKVIVLDNGEDGDKFNLGSIKYYYGYRNAVKKIDALTLDLVQDIVENSPEPPIIIIQGDHGSGAGLVWENMEKTDLENRFAILNAYYLPGIDSSDLPKDITPVNTFRYIFNKYFGTEYSMLEDKHYFSRWSAPHEFIDVTDRIKQLQNKES